MIGHHALALCFPDCLAKIGLWVQAEIAGTALRGIQGNNVVSDLEVLHALTHFNDDARALVAQNGGECALGVIAGQGKRIGMTNPGRLDLNHDLSGGRTTDIHLDNF